MADPLIDLVTQVEVNSAFDEAGLDAPGNLEDVITGVSAIVQAHINRRLVSQSYAVVLNGEGADRISLPNYPITGVAALTIDGLPIPAAAGFTASGYVFSETQVLLRGFRFCRGVQNIGLTYTGGYATIPADIRLAVIEGVRAVAAALQVEDVRAIEQQAGDTRLKFADLSPAQARDLCLTSFVTSTLSDYRRVVPC